MLFHCFLSYLVANEKSALNLIEHPLYVMSFFFFSPYFFEGHLLFFFAF